MPGLISGERLQDIANSVAPNEFVRLQLGVQSVERVLEFPAYPLTIDMNAREVTSVVSSKERRYAPSRIQYELLEVLALNAGKVFTRREIQFHIWGTRTGKTHVIDVHKSELNKGLIGQLALPASPIRTHRGVGLIFDVEPKNSIR